MASNNPNAVEEETEEVNIRVVVRCSPRKTVMPNASSSHRIVFNTQLKQVIVPRVYNLRAPLQPYTFDEVLAPGTTQLDVYNGIVPPILEDVLNGFKCTIIAYGPMGTGKTFTTVGAWRLDESFTWNEDSRTGIIPRVIHHIFERLSGEDFSIKLSLREINHKKTVDLLRARRQAQLRGLIGHTSRWGQLRRLIGLRRWQRGVTRALQAWRIVRTGLSMRKTATTPIHARSSRSHVVFSMTVEKSDADGQSTTGTLHLVDLASRQNFGRTRVPKEERDIKKSLVALGRVITALANRRTRIPYRGSKLTRFLRDSLGGGTKTTIIATVPRVSSELGEMRVIMESASQARSIVNKVQASS